jgi:endo-1,4-beta-xylanase
MVSFTILTIALLVSLPTAFAAPRGVTSLINHETVGKQLEARQGGYYSFWSEAGHSVAANKAAASTRVTGQARPAVAS